MICIVLGITPVDGKDLVLQADVIDNFDWRDCCIAKDEDGTPTLLLSAVTATSTPDDIVEIVSNVQGIETCELWASAPAPLPLRPINGYPIDFREQVDESAAVLQEWGLVRQEKVLNKDALMELRVLVDEAIHQVETNLEKHRPDLEVGRDSFFFQEIATRTRERFDLRIHNANDFVKKHVMGNAEVQALLDHILGDEGDINFDVSVVYSRPGAVTQGWHADGNHTTGCKDAGWENDGYKTQLASPYAICLFLPLIDLNDETGFTQFWPGSHRSCSWAGFGQVAAVTGSTWNGKTSAGDAIWYDYRLWHRGMPNTSTVVRPVLQVIFKQKWYVERVNYGNESIVKES